MGEFNNLDNVMNTLPKGAFLVSGDEKPNVMTIAWGTIGIIWFKKVFIVPVRQSRYTKEFIDRTGVFTVCVPKGSEFLEALNITGTKSGRDIDKFSEAKLSYSKAKEVNSHIIDGCDMYYECKVIYKTTIYKDGLLQEEAAHYPNNDMHTLYFGEIVASYKG